MRISRPFCRMPKNAQNLHQPTYSHLLPELDAEPLLSPKYYCQFSDSHVCFKYVIFPPEERAALYLLYVLYACVFWRGGLSF